MGRFAKHHPNVYAMKEGRSIILAVVLLLPPFSCRGDTLFCYERESALFGLPKEDTTRNQWLRCIYNTFPEQFNQILECVCAAHFTEDYFLNLGVACQLCTKTVSIKWGNSNYRPALPWEYRRTQRNRVRSWPTLHGRVREETFVCAGCGRIKLSAGLP